MDKFKRGDLILASKPYAYVLNNNVRGQRCDFCFLRSPNLKRCTQCQFVFFCGKNCQVAAWNMHKMECKFILKGQVYPSATMRLFVLIMFNVKKYGQDSPYELIDNKRVSFGTLASNAKEIKERDKAPNSEMNTFIVDLKKYIGPEHVPPIDEFLNIYGKMVMHSIDIADEIVLQVVGRGLYLGNSIFTHSCDPDAEKVLNGLTMCYRAMKDLPHRDTFKVTKTFNEQVQLKKDRQADLKFRFFFECKCKRCLYTEYEDLLTKTKVPNDNKHLKRCMESIKRIKEDTLNPKISPYLITDACKKELALQDQILASTHICKIKLLEIAFLNAVTLKNMHDAVKFGKELLQPYKLCYGPYSKTYGLLLFEVGKALLNIQEVNEARRLLYEARDVIKITHGDNHQKYLNILQLSLA